MTLELFTENTTLNEYINIERSNKFAAAALKKRLTNNYMAESLNSRGIIDPNGRYDIQVEWCIDSRHDPDNIHFGIKFILDGMVLAGIIKTDTQKQIRDVTHKITRQKEYKIIVTFIAT